MKKALIAMSGGVDSTMAAYFTQQAGFECFASTMHLFNPQNLVVDGCGSLKEVEDAKSVAKYLNIPFIEYDYTTLFKEEVIMPFVKEYALGRTPNPCINCNRCMKFGVLFNHALELGCEVLVTGHYARLEQDGNRILLKKAVDSKKDQSYVLYMLRQEQLQHLLFPLGDLKKEDVRMEAEKLGFLNAHKHDSQDICFVPDGDYAAVVNSLSAEPFQAGNFVDDTGKKLGRHKGIIHYTVGQRRGLGIAFKEPYYVCRIDAKSRDIVLGTKEKLFQYRLVAENFNWVLGELPMNTSGFTAKIRYHGDEEPVIIHSQEDNTVLMEFKNPQRAITPGQAVVVYDGDVLIGGGTIKFVG